MPVWTSWSVACNTNPSPYLNPNLIPDVVIVHLGNKFVRRYGKSFADRIERALKEEHDNDIKEYHNRKDGDSPVGYFHNSGSITAPLLTHSFTHSLTRSLT